MKKQNVFLVIAIVILVAVTVAGTWVSIDNYKKYVAEKHPEEVVLETEEPVVSETEEPVTSQPEEKEETVDKKTETNTQNTHDKTERLPMFIYFVNESDEDYDSAIKVFEKLKKEYEGKVEFDLKNISKDPKILENFSFVNNQTPALIMDNEEGITGISFKTTDEETLKAEIKKAMK